MKRIAVIRKEDCHPFKCGGYLCIRVCPVNRTGTDCIVVGEDKKAKIIEETCIGCNICVHKCPFDAISIINLPEALSGNPVHRYSENGFSLYSIPIPIFGKVVGILGKNGIGKSTAIKILAGIIKPNFGNFEKEHSQQEIINFFKGTEAQAFFEKLNDREIIVSYKPQQVDLIPKTVKGTVGDLLKKVDEKNMFDEIVEKLGLKDILGNDISTISGGELQRVAIAAAVMKKANVYIFDEPTSYLDIKQRISVSKFIKELADENTAVVVVEHDLIILDYMTDLVHIIYGQETEYGVVSMPKAVRTGINIYLSGFLKEENVRFRDKAIRFEPKPPIEVKRLNELISWNSIKKKLGTFELISKSGKLFKGMVCGVVGENGIGKTTFVKILAEVIKQDSGEINQKLKVAYKPQYLDSDSEEMVANILEEAKKYDNQLMKPLGIHKLMNKQINQLSGGELQRVAIALCLSKEADLFLLDEPSAYLDVEQRLLVSKIIRDFMEMQGKTALIVDHDLLFIDYLSEQLIVFSGEPALRGLVQGPFSMAVGMNSFLQEISITMRRDEENKRPRINKPGSVKDREQREAGKMYYV